MQVNSFKRDAKNWMKPPKGGYRNSRAAGFLIGMAAGPLGAGLFLRSILDFVLSLAMCLAIISLVDLYPGPLCWVACGLYVVLRMKRDLPQVAKSLPASNESAIDPACDAKSEPRPGSVSCTKG